ncbi:MAG: dihydrofolate reductase [Betaproteobacteria bacterium]|nr:dihydrofolate reductase [Betaproteobacteria bacterium]
MSHIEDRFTQARCPAEPPPARRPRICLIAAVASNGIIGAGGGLPWHLPEDLKRFKAMTLGHPVIMGRRTWESLGKPLPGRKNIVVTRRAGYAAAGASVACSLAEALALCAHAQVAFVIGGGELYRAALPSADILALTEIHRDYEGDARFPEFDRSVWREVQRAAHAAADGTRFDFVCYERASESRDRR